MPLSFHPTTSPLFLKLGKIIHAAKTLDTARRTTVPTEIEDVLDQYAAGSIELQTIPDGLSDATNSFRLSGDSMLLALRDVFQNTIIRYVKEDEQQPTDNLEDALRELIRQMEDSNTYVEYIAPTGAVAEVAAVGTGSVAVSMVNRFGQRVPFAHDEVISIECTDATTRGAETFRLRGELQSSKPAFDWPAGSGIDTTLTAVSVGDRRNLITNGSFETADDDDADLPSGWIKGEGTAGASSLVDISPVEVQTLVMTGTPTGGSYYLTWTNQFGVVQQTDSLPYNAGQATVQAALRALVGLEQITVATTGTTPNFTHTITFTGVSHPSQLVAEDAALTGGSSPTVTPGTSTAGLSSAFGARFFRLTSNGTASGAMLYFRLTNLTPETSYALAFNHWLEGSATQGVLGVRLVAGLGGSTITDEEGTANETTVAHSAMTDDFLLATAFFRTPKNVPSVVYLEIAIDTAFDNTVQVRLDGFRLVPATELYVGGPLAAVFVKEDYAPQFAVGDKFTLTVANSYAAEFQHWFNRFCDMEELELQLPSASGTSSSTDEVQTLTASGTVSGGQYKLEFDGQTTADIAYDADNATILAALELLSNIAPGDVALGGGTLPGTPVTFTFGGTCAGRNVPLMTVVAGTSPLSGGGGYGITLTTPGVGYISDSVFIT